MAKTRRVHAHWDPDASVWWAESDDVPGLVSEAPTLDALTDNIAALVPELAALNEPGHEADIAIELVVSQSGVGAGLVPARRCFGMC